MTSKARLDDLETTIENLHRNRHIPPIVAHIRSLDTADLHRLLAEIEAHKPTTAKALK